MKNHNPVENKAPTIEIPTLFESPEKLTVPKGAHVPEETVTSEEV